MDLKNVICRTLCGSAVGALLLGATALHGQQVTTDFDHHAQFDNYHTFSFAKVQTDDPLYQQRLRDDISQDLQSHGLQLVPSGGDLAITAIGGVHNQQQYNTFYDGLGGGFGRRGWGGGFGGGWGGDGISSTSVDQIPVGTLLVDLYDTNTHNLVFRGRAMADMSNKSDKNVKLVQKSVDKMFNHYPPKSAM